MPSFCWVSKVVAMFVGNSFVLALMTAVAPIRYESTVDGYDIFGRPDEIIYRCVIEDEQFAYVVALVTMNAACLLFAIFQAYEARNLSVEFSESTYIFQALILILLVALIGGPVILLARDDANSQTFLMCSIVFVMCCAILVVIFVPKMQYLKKQQEQPTAKTRSGRLSGLFGNSNNLSSFSQASQKGLGGSSTKGSIRISGLDLEIKCERGLEVYGAKTKEELFGELEDLKRKLERIESQVDRQPSASSMSLSRPLPLVEADEPPEQKKDVSDEGEEGC